VKKGVDEAAMMDAWATGRLLLLLQSLQEMMGRGGGWNGALAMLVASRSARSFDEKAHHVNDGRRQMTTWLRASTMKRGL